MMKEKRKHRIGCSLNDEEMGMLNRFLDKIKKISRGNTVSRSDVIRESLISYIKGGVKATSSDDKFDREMLLKQAKELRNNEANGTRPKNFMLLSIVKEIQAFMMIKEPTESQIKSMVIEIIIALKKATGYRILPNIIVKYSEEERDTVN